MLSPARYYLGNTPIFPDKHGTGKCEGVRQGGKQIPNYDLDSCKG